MLSQAHVSPLDGELRSGQSPLIRRIESEYREMPGLTLTEVQAQRLWGLDASTCRAVLGALIRKRFLLRTAKGAYIRAGR
jgi:hypothetical protein